MQLIKYEFLRYTMKKISYKDKNFNRALEPLFNRCAYPPEIEENVGKILNDVRKGGDKAVAKYAKRFDNVLLTPRKFRVSDREIRAAVSAIKASERRAIDSAVRNVSAYAKHQLPEDWTSSPRPGVKTGEKFIPLDRVGVYIPGGTAPLVSTVIHTAAIAKAAGVKEIVAVTPPGRNGKILPELLYAMHKSGVTEIYRLGGVYAVAALAYGTRIIKKVEKIVGPGNAYVTAAKKLVYGEVAIDMVAGPSEIMIIADSSCNPDHIAADLLSQAEHGSGHEQAVLLSTSTRIINAVERSLKQQALLLSRSQTVDAVLKNGVFLIHVRNIDQAVKIANLYAPEHLEIMCRNPSAVSRKITAAGAIFIGKWTPEAAGDFVAGPSHVLPTGGTARYFSGLTADHFFRRISIVKYNAAALQREAGNIAKFAEMEGLDAHGKSALIRT